MLQAVIFDLDGTLVDTAPDLTHATNHVLESEQMPTVTAAAGRSMVGLGGRMLLKRGFASHGVELDPERLERLYARFIEYYSANICVSSVAFPGAVALLERCAAAGLKVGICTNKPEALSVQLMAALGMAGHFGAIVGADTAAKPKPDPAPYFETLRQLGVSGPSLMVGDSETDILTARAAGVPVVGVSFGYTPRPVAEFGPDHVIGHFDELWPILKNRLHG
jgi:phosphoglycolate phosphatase